MSTFKPPPPAKQYADKSEELSTSNEELTVYNTDYSEVIPPASKPTVTETHSKMSTFKPPSLAKQHAADKSDECGASNEDLTVYNTNYSKAIPPASKPSATPVTETCSETSTGKHPPPAMQYASLDPTSRNKVGEYQKPVIRSKGEHAPRKDASPDDILSHKAEPAGEYQNLKHSPTS